MSRFAQVGNFSKQQKETAHNFTSQVKKKTSKPKNYRENTAYISFIEKIVISCCVIFSLTAFICGVELEILPLCGVGLSVFFLALLMMKKILKYFPLLLFLSSTTVYIIMTILVDNPPTSDFLMQLESAQGFVAGNIQVYTDPYYEMYPWQIGWSLIEVFLLGLWNSTYIIKIFQCLCASGILVLVYLLVSESNGKKIAQFTSVALACFPTFFIMTGILTNQVLSAFLYLLGLFLLFSKNIPNKLRRSWMRVCGASLLFALGNFIRPDGIVVVVACIAAFLWSQQVSPYHKMELSKAIKYGLGLTISYLLIGALLSYSLELTSLNPSGNTKADTTWKFAIGTNNESSGTWSMAAVERVNEKIAHGLTRDEANLSVMMENISSPETNIETILKKNSYLWWGNSLTFGLINESSEQPYLYNLLYRIDKSFVVFCFAGCIVSFVFSLLKKRSGKVSASFPLIFFFTCCAYQFIEVQPRYVYFCYIIMFIIAADGFSILANLLRRKPLLFAVEESIDPKTPSSISQIN